MIETIDQITANDLFNAISDPDFARKLYDATEQRIEHHNKWLDFHKESGRDEGVSMEYHKTKAFMKLRDASLAILSTFKA